MEKNLRKKLIFALTALSFTCTGLLSGAEIVRKPAGEPYTDTNIGVSFPARMDTFEKVSVRINPDPRYGTVIAYENETGTFADVFIYRLEADAAKPLTTPLYQAHVKETIQKILTMNQQSKQIKSVKQLPPENAPLIKDMAKFRIVVQDEAFISALYLMSQKQHIIKIRITYSEQMETEHAAVQEFIKLILAAVNHKP